MEAIEKKIKGFLRAATGSMIVLTLVGLIFAIAPGFSISVMRWSIALILLISGIVMIANDAENGFGLGIFSASLTGVVLIIMGLIVAAYPQTVNIVTIVFGAYMIINSIAQLSLAANIKGTSAYVGAVLTNVIGLLCGIVMIFHPGSSTDVIVMVAGIVMMIYGISGIIDAAIIKSRVNDVSKNIKKAKKEVKEIVDEAEEAEVVDKKSSKKSSKKSK